MDVVLLFTMVVGLLLIGVPIAVALGMSSVLFLLIFSDSSMASVAQTLFGAFEGHYTLLAIPFFILASSFMTTGGVAQRIIRFSIACVGHLPGGLAIAGVFACMLFAALSGSSPATVVAIGTIVIGGMRQVGYSKDFAAGVICNAGTLGILIPPSVVLVIYAIITEQNIAKLFLAAFVPGILAALGYVIVISIYVRIYPNSAGIRERVPYAQRFKDFIAVWPVLLVFVSVVGGIYGGIFTPTEGAAVGALGTGLIAYFNGGLNFSSLGESFTVTAKSTAMIFFIVLGAGFYNGFLALTQVPQTIAEWVVSQGLNAWVVLILILVFYLLLGCLMDSLSMILLTVPIFFPVITALDFNLTSLAELQAIKAMAVIDGGLIPEGMTNNMLANIKTAIANGAELTREQMKALDIRMTKGMANRIEAEQVAIWFGIIVLIVVEVGLITPPVGMNLFIINAMDRKTPMVETYKAVILFVGSDLVRVAILVAFPAITLFLLPI